MFEVVTVVLLDVSWNFHQSRNWVAVFCCEIYKGDGIEKFELKNLSRSLRTWYVCVGDASFPKHVLHWQKTWSLGKLWHHWWYRSHIEVMWSTNVGASKTRKWKNLWWVEKFLCLKIGKKNSIEISNSRSIKASNVSSGESKKPLALFWTTEKLRVVTRNSFFFAEGFSKRPF